MYFKLGDYRILERDIKYVRWTLQDDGKWTATICFRDGEGALIYDIYPSEKNKIEEWWDKDIEKAMSYLYYTDAKEETK